MAWKLIDKRTDETLYGPGDLPENWGPVFGVAGFIEEHGPSMEAVGMPHLEWVECSEAVPTADEIRREIRARLIDTTWAIQPDVEMTTAERKKWVQYRKSLQRVKIVRGRVKWPVEPVSP